MKYVGLDVHKKYIYGTVLDERGTVVKGGKFEYTRNGLEKFLHGPIPENREVYDKSYQKFTEIFLQTAVEIKI